MNILFTTSAAPAQSPFVTSEKRPPLGVGALMSITMKEGHKIYFIDNYLQPSNFISKNYLQNNKIDFVGIHSNTICYRDTLRMVNEIENLRTNGLWTGKIILGGPHTSVALETIPDCVDYIVQGEGETAILEIINGTTKERIVKKKRIKNLDVLPFQPWEIFNKLPYDYTGLSIDRQPVFTMNTSRGCPFNCAFCSVGSIWGKEYTFYSADRIIAEIEYVMGNYNAKGIYFREDNFTLNKQRVAQFCEKLISRKINISWACETRVDNMSEDLVGLMSAAGCRAVYLGIESGSQRVLDMLNKNISVGQIENAVKWFKKYNIKTYCSLLVGTPGETYDDYLLTRNLMDKLQPYKYGFNVFVGIPHSCLYNEILEKKLYEHMDDLGLLYMPGYDVKAEYFFNKKSRFIVDYSFKQRTDFDRKLLRELRKNKLKGLFMNAINATRRMIPSIIKKRIKNIIK